MVAPNLLQLSEIRFEAGPQTHRFFVQLRRLMQTSLGYAQPAQVSCGVPAPRRDGACGIEQAVRVLEGAGCVTKQAHIGQERFREEPAGEA